MPSIKTMKKKQDHKREALQKEVVTSCFLRGKCSVQELLSMHSQTGNRKEMLKNYLIKNWQELLADSPTTSWYLRAQVIDEGDINQEFLTEVLKLPKNFQHAFLKGLANCHNRHCLDFGKKYHESFSSEEFFEEIHLILIKAPGSWVQKNKLLKKLLESFSKSREFTKAVSLVDYIPNHPLLKKYLEKHYLNIIGQSQIEKAALHLSRYNQGWHDRNVRRVLNSLYSAHIDAYLKYMRVGCPQRLEKIYSYKKKWNSATQLIAKNEAKYLFKEINSYPRDLGLRKMDLIQDSKCTSGREVTF